MKIFVLNAGSSSIKYKLFDLDQDVQVLASGGVEKIAEEESFISLNKTKQKVKCSTHKEGLQLITAQLKEAGMLKDYSSLKAVAHRVVHGGSVFCEPTVIDEAVTEQIRRMIPLAPLHNPANLEGITAMQHLAPDITQIAFFDTAFHQSMPASAFRYALPESFYYDMQIRRYGFHGISHHYLAKKSAQFLGKALHNCNLITLHLGNGASATAIQNGKSLETSMGFTPLEGLVMGSRSGDLDPGILLYLLDQQNYNGEKLDQLLNHQSGLKGLCGTNDMKIIIRKMQKGEKNAKLAFEMFCQKVKQYIGAYIALLGNVDAIIFSGGIGSNSPEVREAVCANMGALGIILDREKNQKDLTLIGDKGPVKVLNIETDEEFEMADQSVQIIKKNTV